MNSSQPSVTFTLYNSLGVYNSALVICISVLYITGLCVNLFLILVICVESRLHKPMYILLVNLSVSGVIGSSSVCPSIIRHLTVSRQETSLEGCLTQAFLTNVYGSCMFCLLALMAYDRYVSICKPLLYHSIMTPAKVKLMLLLVYSILSLSSGIQVYLTSRLTLCRHTVHKLLCDSLVIANLSCKKTTVISVYGLCCAICLIIFPFVLVVLSYVHIFTVILKTSKQPQWRALQTCTPHLVAFINFSVASFSGFIYNRVSHQVPKTVSIFTGLNFFVIPPLLHPIIYGIKMQEIRQSIHKLMKEKNIHLLAEI